MLNGFDDAGTARLEFLMQGPHVDNRDIGIQMLVLPAMYSVSGQLRRFFEVYRQAVSTHAGVEGVVIEIEHEAELVAVVGNRGLEIVDEELRRNARESSGAANGIGRHGRLSPSFDARRRDSPTIRHGSVPLFARRASSRSGDGVPCAQVNLLAIVQLEPDLT